MSGLRRQNRRGFTLVEVIVVLVILAILAAILVPSMIGWIEKANEKTYITECRACVLAAQTLESEAYGANGGATPLDGADVCALAGVGGSVGDIEINAQAVIRHLKYTAADGTVVAYCSEGGCSDCGNQAVYTVNGKPASGGGEALTPQQKADASFGALADKFNALAAAGELHANEKIDGIYAKTDGMTAKVLYDSLTEEQRAFVETTSWSFVRTGAGWRLYFTTQNYGTESVNDIKVYKYDPQTRLYQFCTQGTKVENGEVRAAGDEWSDWSASMDG